MKRSISFRIPETKARTFTAIAAMKGEAPNAVIEMLIDRYIEENKDIFKEVLAKEG